MPTSEKSLSTTSQMKISHQLEEGLLSSVLLNQSSSVEGNGNKNLSPFLPLIKPFIEINSPLNSKIVLLRRCLLDILSDLGSGTILFERSPALPQSKPDQMFVNHSNDKYGPIDPKIRPAPQPDNIETPCCSLKNYMVIHCFTDGGCLNQGLVDATAAYGYAHFPTCSFLRPYGTYP